MLFFDLFSFVNISQMLGWEGTSQQIDWEDHVQSRMTTCQALLYLSHWNWNRPSFTQKLSYLRTSSWQWLLFHNLRCLAFGLILYG